MDVGVFGHQHHAEGVPVQTGDGVAGAVLPGLLIVALDVVCQGVFVLAAGGMHQHADGFIHHQNVVILVENGQLSLLGGIVRLSLIQRHSDDVSRLYGIVGMNRYTVDKKLVLPLQAVHKAGGHMQFFLQKRG